MAVAHIGRSRRGKQGQAQMQSETGDKRRQEQAGTGQTEQKQASASKDKRRCNQRQMTSAGRNKREEEQASASKDKRRCNQRQVAGRRRERTDGAGAGEDKRERKAGRNGQVQAETGKCRQAPLCRAYNRVGGKRSSFLPTFVFRPLTPPYVRFRIRRFFILRAI